MPAADRSIHDRTDRRPVDSSPLTPEGCDMFDEAFPILSTPDLPRALGFYRGLLGGVVTYQFPPTGDPVYVSVDIGRSQLGLGADPEAATGPIRQRFSMWVYAADCDAAIERLRAAGTPIVAEPADQPWGERVATVADPDGNTVIVGQRPTEPES
jgi:lactoylglutathione lyase